jgi:hypothetical protein
MGLENRIPCKTCGCEIYKDEMKSKENGEYSCCVWYMDNCILEGKPVNDCPTYKKNLIRRICGYKYNG